MEIERRQILFAKENKYFHGISTSIFLFSFAKKIKFFGLQMKAINFFQNES